MSRQVKDPAASVRQRLLQLARQRGDDFQLILARYGAERFLYRLSRSDSRKRFILKGALLFLLWSDEPYRSTRDLDLLGLISDDVQALRRAIEEICAVKYPEDGLVFDTAGMTIAAIREDDRYGGQRAKLAAYLGKTRIPLQIDIGFGDVITPQPMEEDYPTLLDQPAPRVIVYPRETMVAEKFEAMARLGEANSRIKDFCDLAALALTCDFEGRLLREAIARTFTRRRTVFGAETPSALRPAFYSDPGRDGMWRSFLRGNTLRLQLPGPFDAVGEILIAFLFPVWESIARKWEFSGSWTAGGPWKIQSGEGSGAPGAKR